MLQKKLMALMASKGWNQVETSKKTGIAQTAISRILSGEISGDNITTKNAARLAGAFGITIDELLERQPPPGATPLRRIPVLGRVSAGFPDEIPADEIIEYISLPDAPAKCYALIVSGDCMSPGIKDGDYVLFIPNGEIKNGDVVVVNNEWGESSIKRFRQKADEIILACDNPEYPSVQPNEQYKIIGKVITVWRKIRI